MEKIEILAPAGSMEGLKAALCAGADAVYIGGSRFGARAFAQNPDAKEMTEAIHYTHLRGKRIYLTVNTLIKEQEFGDLYDFLAPYYEAGADAAIVQDFGAMRFLAKEFPGLSLHASTQMTLTAPEGVSMLSMPEITRVVPARELSLLEIREIAEKSKKEVEIFVHGALCYCYSGQCLMSSLIGGRSGNRGRCAQPCRMLYGASEKESKYLLSPKDLCGLYILPELIKTKACSFKIEGRMKRPEYAAAVSDAYRRFVDLYEKLGEEGYRTYLKENPTVLSAEVERLQDVYNRGGFTYGLFQKKKGPELMSFLRPGHYGNEVGRVTAPSTGEAEFIASRKLNPQDVLEFRKESGATLGTPGYYEFTMKNGASAGQKVHTPMMKNLTAVGGDRVFRMKNEKLLEELADRFLKQEKKLPVFARFYAKSGEKCSLTLSVLAGERLLLQPFAEKEPETVTICCEGFVCEKAGKLPATKESVIKQLSKTGAENFNMEELQVTLADDVFLPNGLLNELRREAFAALNNAVLTRYKRVLKNGKEESDAKPTEETTPVPAKDGENRSMPYVDCLVSNPSQAEAVLAEGCARRIYLDFFEETPKQILETMQMVKENGIEAYLCLPRICRKDTLLRLKNEWKTLLSAADGVLLRNLESLGFLKEMAETKQLPVVADTGLYVMNRRAADFLLEQKEAGLKELTAPYELSAGELTGLSWDNMSMVVYGRIPLMVSTHCIRKNLYGCQMHTKEPIWIRDRMGCRLPTVQNCADCVNYIYNSAILYIPKEEVLANHIHPSAFRYDFTLESKEEVGKVLRGEKCREEAGFTRGHFKRGVE